MEGEISLTVLKKSLANFYNWLFVSVKCHLKDYCLYNDIDDEP